MIATASTERPCAPSPRLRGRDELRSRCEGWGEGESLRGRKQLDSRRVPLTRNLRVAQIPTSPRKRGEVKKPTEV